MYDITDLINPDLLGLEAIDHQFSTNFGDDITSVIKDLRTLPFLSTADINDGRLTAVVREHTDMFINFYLIEGYNSYATVSVLDINHPLFSDIRRRTVKEVVLTRMLKSQPFISGSVDLKTGRVTGDYKKIPSTIGVGLALLKDKKITDEGIAGMVLHEVMHALTSFVYLGETLTTNNVLQDVSRRAMNVNDVEEHLAILKDIENVYGTVIPNKEVLANEIHLPETYRVIVLDNAVKKSKQEYDIDIYALRGWEQLVDAYVARFGYGKHLAIVLDAIHRLDPDATSYEWGFIRIVKLVFKLTYFFYHWGILGNPFIVVLFMFIGYQVLGNPLESDYDPIPVRIKKIKQQLADSLKDPNLTPEQRRVQLKDIEVIENILDKMNNIPSAYLILWKRSIGAKQNQIIEANYQLEQLANNDMFVAAAKLKEIDSLPWNPNI